MKKILVIASMMLIGFSGAYAANNYTPAGTSVVNQATISYTVGTVDQDNIDSNTDTFTVDNKNDVMVASTDIGNVIVTPNATGKALGFTVTNEGNAVQDFHLAAVQESGDNFNTAVTGIYLESGVTAGYQVGEDTTAITYIDELAPDATSQIFYIVSTIPGTAVNTNTAIVSLLTTIEVGGSPGSEGSPTVNDTGTDTQGGTAQIVFADGDGPATGDALNDGKYSAQGTYEVQSASLTVTKGSCVIWDPVNLDGTGGHNPPKRIPGAVVRYTIQVANAAGAQDATSVSASDILPNDGGTPTYYVTYGTTTPAPTAVAQVGDVACNCATPGTANSGSVSYTSGTHTVNASFDGTISASETQCAYFDVTIN